MFKKVSLRQLDGEKSRTCYRVDYWQGIDERYAMVSAHDRFDAEQRFRKRYPHVYPTDVIDIFEMEDK